MSSSSTALNSTNSQVVQGAKHALMGAGVYSKRISGVDNLQHLYVVYSSHQCECKHALVCSANWPKLVFVGFGDCDERLLVLTYVLPHLSCTSGNVEECTVSLV